MIRMTKPISEWHLDKDIQTELDKKEELRNKENMKGEGERIKENRGEVGGGGEEVK